MSKVEAISSARDMETLVSTAFDQYDKNRSPANLQYLREILTSWQNRDWAINKLFIWLDSLMPKPAKQLVFTNAAAINNNTTFTQAKQVEDAATDILVYGWWFQIVWPDNVEPFAVYDQSLNAELYISKYGGYEATRVLDHQVFKSAGGNQGTPFFWILSYSKHFDMVHRYPHDTEFTIKMRNYSGQQIHIAVLDAHLYYAFATRREEHD